MKVNFGLLSFSINFNSIRPLLLLSALLYVGIKLILSFQNDFNSWMPMLFLIIGIVISFTKKVVIVNKKLTIRSPFGMNKFSHFANEIKEYGYMKKKGRGGINTTLYRIVPRSGKSIDIPQEVFANFDELLEFLKKHKVEFTRLKPFEKDLL